MVKTLRYLKPFWLSVLAIIALTFMQVQFELALPDYMSNIVTYGIQYNGIDDPTPQALRASTYDHMRLFMSEAEQNQFSTYYTLEKAGSSMQEIYPALAYEDGYIRTGASDSDNFLTEPFLIVSMLENEEIAAAMGDQCRTGLCIDQRQSGNGRHDPRPDAAADERLYGRKPSFCRHSCTAFRI